MPRRAPRLATNKEKQRLADLPGGDPQRLSAVVHELLAWPTSLDAAVHARYVPQYPKWLAMLHSGFSLLLHGCGSKKELLEDFARGLDGPTSPVLVVHGFSSSIRLRELLVMILTDVLQVPKPPVGSSCALVKQIHQGFAMAAASASPVTGTKAVPALRRLIPPIARMGFSPGPVSAAAACASSFHAHTAVPSPPTVRERLDERRRKSPGSGELRLLADSECYVGDAASTIGKVLNGVESRKRHRGQPPQPADAVPRSVSKADEYVAPSPSQRLGAGRRLREKRAILSPSAAYDLVPVAGDPRAPFGRAVVAGGGADAPRAASRRSATGRVPAHVYLVVHAIDGAALRGEEQQALLAQLAAIPQVHLVASCSHCNAALIWDARKARAFNWAWVEAPTGATYAHESVDTIHELLGCLYESAVGTEGRSAQIVLAALTQNARKVFKLLLTYQLENPGARGLAFTELMKRSKAAFAASNEKALKQHLNEFATHHLVATRSGVGGQEMLFCTLPADTMKQVVEGLS